MTLDGTDRPGLQDPTTVRSIERAFDVLRLLSLGPSGLAEIASGTDLAKSTCLRILATLEKVGAVSRSERGVYSLGAGIAELAQFGDTTATLIMVLRPHLVRLATQTGEAAGFGIRVEDRVQHLVQETVMHAVQVRDYTGHSVPLHVAAAGVAILAHLPTVEQERYLAGPLERYTDRTVVDPAAIRDRLAEVRRSGRVWTVDEFAEGLSTVASPVFATDGSVLGAISVHGPTYRFPGESGASVERMVRDAASQVLTHRTA
jgi:DNA-binding IclR family transcriptional regulator